jgi:2-keto-4-pentenoate hydratase
MLGRAGEAKAAVGEYFSLLPGATLEEARAIPSRNRAQVERFVAILRDLGVPERTPAGDA